MVVKLKEGFTGERALVIPQMIVRLMEEDALTAALHITDIGYYPKARHHFRHRLESVDQYVFIYCVDGAGSYSVNGQEYSVTAGQYFILPAGQPHLYTADVVNPWTIYWIHFKGTLAAQYACDAIRPQTVRPDTDSRIASRHDLFEEMFQTLHNGYSTDNLRYVSSLFHYYLGTLRFLLQYRAARVNASARDDADVATRTIHYMKENLDRRLTLEALAEYAGYSASHFSALFRHQTGHAPLTYFNLLKIQHACLLFDTTDMKVGQVCYKIGIGDTYYFSRLFSKIMGMSPREYRKTKKG